jgi:aminomethyltransferase
MSAEPTAVSHELKRTPLHGLHVALGARLVPFAGYEMPVQYPAGVLKEHFHTRAAAGLFDVSHMGQIRVRARSGSMTNAARQLETLLSADIAGLAAGRQRYSFFTNDSGGMLDDLMIAHRGDHYLLVVNAARKGADLEFLHRHIGAHCEIEMLDRALVAVQGPQAEAALSCIAPGCDRLHFMEAADFDILGATCTIVRSGYTGEDGFEMSTPPDVAREICERLLENPAVMPIGLGARDSLRLEAGLCLYGSDINEATTPVEAGLQWAIPKVRRANGAREGGFPGAAVILRQLGEGVQRARVGLRPDGRQPVRAGAQLFATEHGGDAIGAVTSGGFSPSLDGPVALGYVPIGHSAPATRLFADVRGRRLAVAVAPLPFVPTRYKRAARA